MLKKIDDDRISPGNYNIENKSNRNSKTEKHNYKLRMQ